MNHSATTSLVVKAPIEKVWDALTKPELVKQYFFNTDMETTWEPGSPIFFRGEWQGKQYEDKGTVLEFNPLHSFSYNYWSAMSGTPDVPESYQILKFMVNKEGDGTKIIINQSNVESPEKAEHSLENWNKVLKNLKQLVESQE